MTEANIGQTPDGYIERDVHVGHVSLPLFLQDQTWHEFRHDTHPIRSILVDTSGMPPSTAKAWLRSRRERLVATGLAAATDPESFSNPCLVCEGFMFHPTDPLSADDITYFVTLETNPEFLTLMVQTGREAAGFVRALVERVVEDQAEPALAEGWAWHKIATAWLPIPSGSEGPRRFEYEGGEIHVTVQACEPGRSPELMRTELALVVSRVSVGDLIGRTSSLAVSGQGMDSTGEPVLFTAAMVASQTRGLLLQARARGAECATLAAEWRKIVDSVKV